MRCLMLLVLLLTSLRLSAQVQEYVAEGEADARSLLHVGSGMWQVQREGRNETFRWWLTVCLDLTQGEGLRSACAQALGGLAPQPSVLVSGFHVAAAEVPGEDGPWLFAVGTKVPTQVAGAVLRVVREHHRGPLVLRGWNDEDSIISIGPLMGGSGTPAPASTIDSLLATSDEKRWRDLLGSKPPPPFVPYLIDGKGEVLLDLDLRAPDGTPPPAATSMRCRGVTWTADGLFLPGQHLVRYPPQFPSRDEDAPIPSAPYTADLSVPGLKQESVTVTLILCQASNDLERDNLFSLGRQSRWLSAQVGRTGELLVGLDNRWILMPALDRDQVALTLRVGTWHVLTIGSSADGRLLRAALDGRLASDFRRLNNNSDVPPRSFTDPEAGVLSFVDPGNPRHLHGLVRRVIVHRGMLTQASILALHHDLDPTDIPAPTTPLLTAPLLGTSTPTGEPAKAKPQNANDF